MLEEVCGVEGEQCVVGKRTGVCVQSGRATKADGTTTWKNEDESFWQDAPCK